MEVRCGQCGWQGDDSKLTVVYVPDRDDVIPEAGCPACLSEQYLEFKEE